MQIITIDDTLYTICGTTSIETKVTFEELKNQYNADTILQNGNMLYICQSIINAEFEEVSKKVKKMIVFKK